MKKLLCKALRIDLGDFVFASFKLILLFALLVALSSAAMARVGDSRAAIVMKYGSGIANDIKQNITYYRVGGAVILCYYDANDSVYCECFTLIDRKGYNQIDLSAGNKLGTLIGVSSNIPKEVYLEWLRMYKQPFALDESGWEGYNNPNPTYHSKDGKLIGFYNQMTSVFTILNVQEFEKHHKVWGEDDE